MPWRQRTAMLSLWSKPTQAAFIPRSSSEMNTLTMCSHGSLPPAQSCQGKPSSSPAHGCPSGWGQWPLCAAGRGAGWWGSELRVSSRISLWASRPGSEIHQEAGGWLTGQEGGGCCLCHPVEGCWEVTEWVFGLQGCWQPSATPMSHLAPLLSLPTGATWSGQAAGAKRDVSPDLDSGSSQTQQSF